jgi:Cytochrome P450
MSAGRSTCWTSLPSSPFTPHRPCLIGKKFREQLDRRFAQLYHELERGTDPLCYVDPYMDVESFRVRDAARVKAVALVQDIMSGRIAKPPVDKRGRDMPLSKPNWTSCTPMVRRSVSTCCTRSRNSTTCSRRRCGAGRHRCVGAAFAQMQIKAIFSVLLREYTFEMAQPPESYRNDHSKMMVQLERPARVRYRRRNV